MYFDLHLHLVPGVDDGVRDLDEAAALARVLVDHGWEGGAVTPHIRPGRWDNRPDDLRAAIAGLAGALSERGVGFDVRAGAEHYLDAGLVERILAGDCVPLGGGGRHVLMEAPLTAPVPGLRDLVFRLGLKGVTPVFAHPERCAAFADGDRAAELAHAGAVLQLDLGSLSGAYGRGPRKLARRFLDAGLYTVAGTDLHTARQAERLLPRWLKTLERHVGPGAANRLLSDNPRRLVAGKESLS